MGDRLLNLFAPKTRASACHCVILACTTADGQSGTRECCKVNGGTRYCSPCEAL
jgi:hypothetical protein